ncbi:restriction endonuclease subunit S [Mongoliitalea lutea]|nr:restriction endonuclease subunit S [Mongoliitalea lutea]
MEKKLPKGWKVLPLHEISSIKSGGTPSRAVSEYWGGNIPWVKISDIRRLNVSTTEESITEEGIKNSSTKIFPKGTILFTIFASIGKVGILQIDAATNQAIAGITPKSIVESKFLTYSLINLSNKIQESGKGVAQNNINLTILKNTKISLPPLPEQQRIVGKLDALFGHLDSLREKLDRIPTLLKNFRQQVLTQAVTGELTKEWREGKGLGEWEYIDLQEVADVVDPHPSHRTPPPVIGGIPYISIKDVDSKGRIDFSNSTLVSSKVLEEHIKRYELKEGDLGFGKIGTLGKPFQLPIFKERTYTLSANIILIQPKSNYNPKFLFYYLDSPIINKLLKEGAKATSQPAFGIKKARVFPTPNPSKEEQKEIVSQVDALFSLADKIESQYVSLKAKIDQLPQAILAKAFRGELVGQEVKEYVVEEIEGLMAAEEQLSYRVKTKT